MPLSVDQLEKKIREGAKGIPLSFSIGKNGLEVHADRDYLVELCKFLCDDPELQFDYLRCLSAVDWFEEGQMEVVYHLYSMKHGHGLVVKVRIGREDPRLPSVSNIWATANWHEREAYDLFGIVFEGHPDLRRILLPQDWVGHPLRKDYSYDPVEFDEEYASKVRRGEIA
jgi:NADH/F420H2 dehydrogenase subunit C